MPLLAFDEAGYRLGYGKGFFDMTLAELRRRPSGVLAVASPMRRSAPMACRATTGTSRSTGS